MARENFGCGSSREHAPWALDGAGFRAIIAPSFADIFRANCFKNGLLPIALDAERVDQLFAQMYETEGFSLTVDLEKQLIETPKGETIAFETDDFGRNCLLKGLDDIGITLQSEAVIRDFERKHQTRFPWVFETLEV